MSGGAGSGGSYSLCLDTAFYDYQIFGTTYVSGDVYIPSGYHRLSCRKILISNRFIHIVFKTIALTEHRQRRDSIWG